MKLIFYPALFCLLTIGCNNEPSASVDKMSDNKSSKSYAYNKLEGIYEGDFGGSGNIQIVLSDVTGTNAVGYSLHKGLKRAISGKMSPAANGFEFQLPEPGDNPYDGTFNFRIDTATFKLTGSWEPVNNKKLSAVAFVLLRSATNNNEISHIMYDSIGAEYHFEGNGLVFYRYYPDDQNQEVTTQQYEEIKGNWRKTTTEYIIDWQKNNKFQKSRFVFKIVPYPGKEGIFYLEGEGLKIDPRVTG